MASEGNAFDDNMFVALYTLVAEQSIRLPIIEDKSRKHAGTSKTTQVLFLVLFPVRVPVRVLVLVLDLVLVLVLVLALVQVLVLAKTKNWSKILSNAY